MKRFLKTFLLVLLSASIMAQSFPTGLKGLPAVSRTKGANAYGLNSVVDPLLLRMPTAGYASVGVFDASGRMVRELRANQYYDAGTYQVEWDGSDNEGNLVAGNLDSYRFGLLRHNVTSAPVALIGNTSTNIYGNDHHRGWNPTSGMVVINGRLYYSDSYQEGGLDTGINWVSLATPNLNNKVGVYGSNGFTHLAASPDGQWLYALNNFVSNGGSSRNFATRMRLSDHATVGFTGSSTSVTTDETFSNVIKLNTVFSQAHTGIAASDNFLFIGTKNSTASLNSISIHNPATGATYRTITANNVSRIAVEGNNALWAIQGTSIVRYSVNSDTTLTAGTTITGLVAPLALAVSPDGSTVAIVDGGSSMQVKFFATGTGVQTDVLGQQGGYATSSTVADDKFLFTSNISQHPWQYSCITYAPDNSIWLGDSQNKRVLHFAANKQLIKADVIQKLNRPYTSWIDPNDHTRVFQGYMEFRIDWSKPFGPNTGFWTYVANHQGALPANTYNDHYEMHNATTSKLNGRTYCMFRNTATAKFEVWELVTGGVPRKTTTTQLALNSRFDADLNICRIDYSGGSQKWMIRQLTGFDGSGNPIYGAEFARVSTNQVGGINPTAGGSWFSPATITESGLYVSFDADAAHGTKYYLGAIAPGDSVWKWRSFFATHSDYGGDLPKDSRFDIGNGMGPDHGYAGSVAKAAGQFIAAGYHGEFWKASQTDAWYIWHQSGLYVTMFGGGRPRGVLAPLGFGGNSLFGDFFKEGDHYYVLDGEENDASGLHLREITGLQNVVVEYIPIKASKLKRTRSPLEDQPARTFLPLFNVPWNSVLRNENSNVLMMPNLPASTVTNDSRYAVTSSRTYKQNRADNPFQVDVMSFDRNDVVGKEFWMAVKLGYNRSWSNYIFKTNVNFYPGSHNRRTNTMEVHDNQGKAIIRFEKRQIDLSGNYKRYQLYANNQLMIEYRDTASFRPDGGQWTCTVAGSSVTINLQAGGRSLTVTGGVADAGADASNPMFAIGRSRQISTFGSDTQQFIYGMALTNLTPERRIYVGNPNTNQDLTIDGPTLGAQPGDVIVVRAGTYGQIRTTNLQGTKDNPIRIQPAGDVTFDLLGQNFEVLYVDDNTHHVVFDGRVDGVGMTRSMTFRNSGYRGIEINGNASAQNLTFAHLNFSNIADAVLRWDGNTAYAGTDATAMTNLKVIECDFSNTGGFDFRGAISSTGNVNRGLLKNFEFGFNSIHDRNSIGDALKIGHGQGWEIHDNVLRRLNVDANNGIVNTEHNGLFHLYGQGRVFNNDARQYQGNLIRLQPYHLAINGDTTVHPYVEAFNNIHYDTPRYGGDDVNEYSETIYGTVSTWAKVRFANSTYGKLNTLESWSGQGIDIYNHRWVEIFNCLGFELHNGSNNANNVPGKIHSAQGSFNLVVESNNQVYDVGTDAEVTSGQTSAKLMDYGNMMPAASSPAVGAGRTTNKPYRDRWGTVRMPTPTVGAVEQLNKP